MKLEVRNGSFTYPGLGRKVLDNIDFSLGSGDVLTVLGPNGAGKTTLLRCVTGLIRWLSGSTVIDGADIRDIPRKKLWQTVSYVPQAKYSKVGYTVGEMILLGRGPSVMGLSLPGKADADAVDAAIERTGIGHLRTRRCDELSGGEYQMVLIARALVSSPQILVLDEPESNLDFKNQMLVLDLISQLSDDGLICIFNTHYPAHALRRGNKALMLSRDGKYCFGAVSDIITRENIREYFGVDSVIGYLESGGARYADVIPTGYDCEES